MAFAKPARRALIRCLAGVALGPLLCLGLSSSGSAAEYTAQEQANIATVRAFFDAMNASEARGDMASAVPGIAEKYFAPEAVVHGRNGDQTREEWAGNFSRPMPAPPGESAALKGPRPPSKEAMLMAKDDYVIHLATRDPNSNQFTWHMIKLKDGKFVEEW